MARHTRVMTPGILRVASAVLGWRAVSRAAACIRAVAAVAGRKNQVGWGVLAVLVVVVQEGQETALTEQQVRATVAVAAVAQDMP